MPAAAAPTVPPDPAPLPAGQQERRDRIVRAASDLLQQGEYDTIQMRDVAQQARVAVATIYRYFTSKEHLYAAALLEWAADYPTHVGPAGTAADDEQQLRNLMRRAVRAFERYPQMMRVVIVLESSNDPNARALFDQFGANNGRALMDALSSTEADTAAAIVEAVNCVMVTRLRAWALGRCSIRDVNESLQRTIDLVFARTPAA